MYIAKSFMLYTLLVLTIKIQAQQIYPSVIGVAGQSFEYNQGIISWTLGEPVIKTLSFDQFILSQGFHQPLLEESTSYESPQLDFLIKSYPNPVLELLLVESTGDRLLYYTINNIHGQLLRKGIFIHHTTISTTTFPPGTYLLSVYENKQLLKSTLIEKL